MKLSASIPLDERKTAALAKIDQLGAERATTQLAPMWTVYNEKANLARDVLAGAASPDFIIAEAEGKGVAVETLCQQIVARAEQARTEALTFESIRQRIKAQIRAATSEQEITHLVNLFAAGG